MYVTSGAARLACSSGGTGEPAALLLHAGVTDRRSWEHLTPRLPGQWVSFDARCFGETTYDQEDGWSAVRDAVAVLDAHELDRAVLVGGSMGGRTALDLTLTHPDRVAGLVLIGTAVSGAPAPRIDPEAEPLVAQYDAAEEAGEPEATNRIEAHVWLDGPLAPEGRVSGPVRTLFEEMNRVPLTAAMAGERHRDAEAWDRLSEITVPTLALVGEHDFRHLRERSERIAHEVARGRFELLPGVAHLPQLEGDPRTLEVVVEFVAGLAT